MITENARLFIDPPLTPPLKKNNFLPVTAVFCNTGADSMSFN